MKKEHLDLKQELDRLTCIIEFNKHKSESREIFEDAWNTYRNRIGGELAGEDAEIDLDSMIAALEHAHKEYFHPEVFYPAPEEK